MTAASRRSGPPFRFRFLVRGDQGTSLLRLAVLSLERCHPTVSVVVVDANDRATVDPGLFGTALAHEVVHLEPGEDVVAKALGRGSRQHVFHWRHSPQVRAALPPFEGFDVHADADLLFLRPLDLTALAGPLRAGRIAAVVDESTLDHYAAVSGAPIGPSAVAPGGGEPGGPMWQTGLIFSDPADDGGLYDLVWEAACEAAVAGRLAALPDHDMALVAAVLGYGGALWHRALPLGHDWNYITDAVKDPGIFGRVAHYGGRRAKEQLLTRTEPLIQDTGAHTAMPWGTVHRPPAEGSRALGPARGLFGRPLIDDPGRGSPPLPLPLCLTWAVPPDTDLLHVVATVCPTSTHASLGEGTVTLHVHVDGRPRERRGPGAEVSLTADAAGASTVTVVAVGDRPGLVLRSLELTTSGGSR